MKFYFCYLCGTYQFLYAQQATHLSYCNLKPEEKEKLDAKTRAEVLYNLQHGIPIDTSILYSEMPLGFTFGYVRKMEDRYNWKKGKGNFEEVKEADARGEITYQIERNSGWESSMCFLIKK